MHFRWCMVINICKAKTTGLIWVLTRWLRILKNVEFETANEDEGETLGESDDDNMPRKEKLVKTFKYIKSKYNLSYIV